MAKVIEFHVPARLQKKIRWIPRERRGKMIEFPADIQKKSA